MNDKHLLDGFLGGISITALAWVQYINDNAAEIMTLGGIILLVFRILIAIKEFRKS